MKSFKPIDREVTWNDLIRKIEPDPCILLKGDGSRFIAGWEIESEFVVKSGSVDFDALQAYIDTNKENYIFGYISYDVKNSIEKNLVSNQDDSVEFYLLHFFSVKQVIDSNEKGMMYYGSGSIEEVNSFLDTALESTADRPSNIDLLAKTPREEYLKNVRKLQDEIQFGNIYEINYCVNFSAQNAVLNPVPTFEKLNSLTEAPFSVYFHLGDHYVLCASPERYIQRKENVLISEPIKGTARRGKTEPEDDQIKRDLSQNPKERSENIMIVDLVRNDMSKIATKNSVHADKICEVRTFKNVHQLVSTISCTLNDETTFTEIIKATFPMGSMTGAPKISAMEIAERTENFRRGLYSGTIGYIAPGGYFDFNVVIRSILYNHKKKVVSCSVGGAITINAVPEKEYEECLLKLKALQDALT